MNDLTKKQKEIVLNIERLLLIKLNVEPGKRKFFNIILPDKYTGLYDCRFTLMIERLLKKYFSTFKVEKNGYKRIAIFHG